MSYNWFELTMFGFIGLMGIGLTLFIVDFCWTKTETWDGIVIGRSFTPSQTSTGVGFGVTGSGQPGSVITTSTSSEEWKVIVRIGGRVVSATTSPERWATLKKDESVRIEQSIGRIFGITHSLWVK